MYRPSSNFLRREKNFERFEKMQKIKSYAIYGRMKMFFSIIFIFFNDFILIGKKERNIELRGDDYLKEIQLKVVR